MTATQEYPFTLRGPYDSDANQRGPVTKLYTIEKNEESTSTQVNKEQIAGQVEDEAIVSALEGSTELSLTGQFNIARINGEYPYQEDTVANESGIALELPNGDEYPTDSPGNDPAPPLAQLRYWLIEFEMLTIPLQGIGYKASDFTRTDTVDNPATEEEGNDYPPDVYERVPRLVNSSDETSRFTREPGVLVEEAEWEVTAGEGAYGEWRLELMSARGVQSVGSFESDGRRDAVQKQYNRCDASRDYLVLRVPNPATDGNFVLRLGSPTTVRRNRKLNIDAKEMLHAADVDRIGVIEEGVSGTLSVQGAVSQGQIENDGEAADRAKDTRLQTIEEVAAELDRGHGKEVALEEPITGREFTGVLSSTSTTFKSAEPPNKLEYSVELEVATTDFILGASG